MSDGEYWSALACVAGSRHARSNRGANRAPNTTHTGPLRLRRQIDHALQWGFDVSIASLTVDVGDTVTWTWVPETLGAVDHDIVSGTRAGGFDGNFRSALQSSNSGSFTHTFACNGR